MADAKVLIVEDEVIVAMGLERSLGSFGYDVVGLATRGEDAVRMAGELMPDLALIDINLGDEIDGINVAERIGNNWDIPVVYLTSYSGEETLARAIQTNPYGYLTKPARPREIYTTIETVLQKHRAIKAERALESGEKKFTALFNSIPFPACIIFASEEKKPGTIADANEKFLDAFGIKKPDIRSLNPSLAFGEEFSDAFSTALKSGDFEYECTLRLNDGVIHKGRTIIRRADYGGKTSAVMTYIPEEKKTCKTQAVGGNNHSDPEKDLVDSIKKPLSAIIAISGLNGGMEFGEISRNAEKIQDIISEYEK